MTALREMNCDNGIFLQQKESEFSGSEKRKKQQENEGGGPGITKGRGGEGKHISGELHHRYWGGEQTRAREPLHWRNPELVMSSAGVMRAERCSAVLSSPSQPLLLFSASSFLPVEVEVESCR